MYSVSASESLIVYERFDTVFILYKFIFLQDYYNIYFNYCILILYSTIEKLIYNWYNPAQICCKIVVGGREDERIMEAGMRRFLGQ